MSDPNKNLNLQKEVGAMDMLLSFLGIKSSKPVKPAEKKMEPSSASSKAETKEPIYKVGTRRFKPSPLGND